VTSLQARARLNRALTMSFARKDLAHQGRSTQDLREGRLAFGGLRLRTPLISFTRSKKLAGSGDRITTPQMIASPGVRTFPDRRPAP
jgi:hypothetical protein